MAARTGFGDETWRLAREGDIEGLDRAATLLLDAGDLLYEGHRAKAFARAVAGRLDDGLAELNEGWNDDWPAPAVYATDIARIRLLAGDGRGAIDALELAMRSSDGLHGSLGELLAECVRRQPQVLARALRLAGGTGSVPQRSRATLAVLRAR